MFKLLPRRFRHLVTLTTFAFALQAASPWALAAAPNDHTPDHTPDHALDHASAPAHAADLVSAHAADPGPVYGAELQGYTYPAPVHEFAFTSQGVPMKMAYLDVKGASSNGRTVVLMHGKNFCAATWKESISVLSAAGYRVIAPDQIGFCKSTKPEHYQYSFQQLARNTRALLASLGIDHAIMIGHS
ncbi:alpha/beta fold hydrolase, partial [Burkholderia sp. L27(2015)]|uniref:alpha/beta fold hydrolase n=1 Tax=Burkholderia sp. L27(2015) TaxID=1641858 RepID=UPI0020B1759E